MRFADPHACPDCRGVIAGEPACPHCGLDLSSLEVRQLWQVLLQADDLLARAGRRRVARQPVPQGAPTPPFQPSPVQPSPVQPPPVQQQPFTPPPGGPGFPSYPAPPQPSVASSKPWPVGTILLVLGAFGLVVAGTIFVTRSWEDLGLAGRTLILIAVTAVMGALGVWVTRRPLRASAEAVWSVFLALLTLDFFAARHEGLVGLGSLDVAAAWLVWGVVLLALAVAIALWARPHLSVVLATAVVAGGAGIVGAGFGAGGVVDDIGFAWRAVIALVVVGVLALLTRPADLAALTIVARLVVAAFFVYAYIAALVELGAHPAIGDVLAGGHGVPMMLMAVAAFVIAAVVPIVRFPATALAVLAVVALVVVPTADGASDEVIASTVALLAAVLAAFGIRGTDDWMRGVRVAALPVIVAVALMHLALLGEVGGVIGLILQDPWALQWNNRLDVASVENHELWAVPVVLAGLLVVAWALPRWPEASGLRRHATSIMTVVAALGAIEAVVALRLPVWAVAAVLLALALVALALRVREAVIAAGPVALLLVLTASTLAGASHGVSSATWLAGAAILAPLAIMKGPDVMRVLSGVVAGWLAVAGVGSLVGQIDLDETITALVVLGVGLTLVAVANLRLPEHPARVPLELAGAAGVVVGLAVPGSTGEMAVRWTLVGAVLVALGLSVAGRRWYVWPGGVSLLIAYVLLIVESGSSFVEAYTLPLGVVALAIGVHQTLRGSGTSTWATLGPGLALALLPSVPQALADPTDLRALLLGAGAVVALAAGVRLSWQAPFVAGTSILALLVLCNIGPYANAAPRVLLIAAVSAVLLGVGITWEDRVRDGRRVVGYVRSMR
ncbi:hypothetical protein GEV27_11025 [Aeromicrobium sp. S22]|uniref:SCO7613 C-terminal domain-containing membrane protein n=1 Tax=Aeromicrobium sp. S22 TaxID=2662029 RepID=UPI00129E4B64|nr:hypothetical protein [Aeromicrobium sp. S22]MRK02054.1 hypothetical protein [Aeromicrobium sp. S22]